MSDTILLYDTTLRDGTQREGMVLSLADKVRIARRLDEAGFPYVEGGWPGSNPKDVEFFEAARGMTWQNARIAAFGSTRHRANRPDQDPNLAALVEARDAGHHHLRQELAAARDRGPGRDAGREPGHGRGLGRLLSPGRQGRGRLRRRALLRRLQGRPRLRPGDAACGARGRRRDARPVRHERRLHDRRGRGHRRRRHRHARPRRRGPLRHPRPRRRRPGRGQLAGRGARRACATSRARSTATASAAATPTS